MRGSRSRGEEGAALVTVIGITFVMTLFATVGLNYAVRSMPQARTHQDWNAALAAAEAGLDDYLARLNRNPVYYQTATPEDPGENAALAGWAELPNSEASYHYTVDASQVAASGTVIVTSTGRVRDATRTVQVTFRPAGFLDFIYFSDYEIVDPAMASYSAADCERYHYDGRSDQICAPAIRFVTGDVVRGPAHSNDAILIDGNTQWLGPVTTSWRGTHGLGHPNNRLWRNQFHNTTYTSNPFFSEGDDMEYAERVSMPPTNKEISAQTTSATGGCMYYGPTYIHVNGDQMRVSSPLSQYTPSGGIPTNPHCIGASHANSGWIDQPPNGVIYVANALHRSFPTCNSTTHPLGLPNTGDVSIYPCNVGDVFIWGELDGQLTVAAENDITIVADLTYEGGWEASDDLLGLIADNYVQIWHPVNNSNQNLNHTGSGLRPYLGNSDMPSTTGRTWQSPEVHAAILSLNHSFRVQNYNRGQPFNSGALTVRGAIAQKFRGPVGTSFSSGAKASGYDKDYAYDYRLQYLSPPFFIEPVEAQWRQRTWAELPQPDDLPPW